MYAFFITDAVYDELLEKANAVASARVDALFGPQQQQQPVDSSEARSLSTETRSRGSQKQSTHSIVSHNKSYEAQETKDTTVKPDTTSKLEDTRLPQSSHINDVGPNKSRKTYADTSKTPLMNITRHSKIRTFSVPINTTTNLEFDKPVRAEPQSLHTSSQHSTQRTSAFTDTENFFTPIEVQLPVKRTKEVHRVSANKPQRYHKERQTESTVHTKGFSSKPTKPINNWSTPPAPEVYQANSVDYSYKSKRAVSPIDLTDNFYSETTTRKLKPKDKKIYSHSTTEKVPIPSYEKEEGEEHISIEVGHLRDVELPEVNANSFGSPPKAVQDYFSKSHFEFQASDWPLITPPIEKYRQRVVDKYLADKTRGGTRTYKSTFGHSSSYDPELEGYSPSTAALLARPPPPQPILYEPKSRSTTRLNTSYTLSSSPEPSTSYYHTHHIRVPRPAYHADTDLTDGYYSDPEDFIKNTVQRLESKDANLIPVDLHYSDYSDEDHTTQKRTERETIVQEQFVPKTESFFTPIEVELPSRKTKEVRRITEQSVYKDNRRSAEPPVQQRHQHLVYANGLDDIERNVEYVDPRQSRKPARETANRTNMSYVMNEQRYSSGQGRQQSHRHHAQVNAK